MIALPTSSCKRDAGVVKVAPFVRAAANELGPSLFDHSPLNAVNFPAELGLPAEPVFILLGIDQLLDMARTSVNVLGNCLATVVIARWENDFVEGPAE